MRDGSVATPCSLNPAGLLCLVLHWVPLRLWLLSCSACPPATPACSSASVGSKICRLRGCCCCYARLLGATMCFGCPSLAGLFVGLVAVRSFATRVAQLPWGLSLRSAVTSAGSGSLRNRANGSLRECANGTLPDRVLKKACRACMRVDMSASRCMFICAHVFTCVRVFFQHPFSHRLVLPPSRKNLVRDCSA